MGHRIRTYTVTTLYHVILFTSGAAAALTIAGMKILRTAWTDLPRQYLILIFTLLFFNFDYSHLSEGLPLDYFIIAILFIKVSQGGTSCQPIYTYLG